MGGIFSPPQAQTPPPPPPLPQNAIPPTFANAAVKQAGQSQQARAAAAAGSGMGNTLKTGGQGDLVPAPTAKSSLVGG